MSTTIDTARLARRAARFAGAGLAVAIVAAEPTHSVIVFGPQETVLRAVASGSTRLVDAGTGFVIANGRDKGFVRKLYAAGAWLVLPASIGGCRGRVTVVASRKG